MAVSEEEKMRMLIKSKVDKTQNKYLSERCSTKMLTRGEIRKKRRRNEIGMRNTKASGGKHFGTISLDTHH